MKTLIHTDVSFVAEMKRKNEILHDIRTVRNDIDRNKLEKANRVEELSASRVFSTLETESVERRGFFEADEHEDSDRLGLTGFYHF